MAQTDFTYIICDQCGGAIPDNADRIHSDGGILYLGGVQTTFMPADFCCSAHFETWLNLQPNIPTPAAAGRVSPPYSQPPPVTQPSAPGGALRSG